MIEYSIVIPAYNEADKIVSSLNQVLGFMPSFADSFEVLVVDDGSKDATAQLVAREASEHSELRLIKNPHKGKGPSIWTGVMEAKGKYIYLADADLSAPISELKKFATWIKDHDFDLVIASREGLGAKRIGEPLYRHLMGRVFNYLVQLIILPGIKDTQCGFKLFKASVAKDIFGRLKIYGADAKEIQKSYMGAFDVEVLFLARKLGYCIKQVPVIWTYATTTRLNPIADAIKMLTDILRIRLNNLKGVYKNI